MNRLVKITDVAALLGWTDDYAQSIIDRPEPATVTKAGVVYVKVADLVAFVWDHQL